MRELFIGIAALALVSVTLPASAVERSARGSSDVHQHHSARPTVHKQRRRTVRRHHPRRHEQPPYVTGLYGLGGGYGGSARMPGDPLGLNPAVEFYRSWGRCVTDEGYGRYTFCDD